MIHQYPMLMFLSQHLQAHTFYTVTYCHHHHDSDLFTLTYFKQYNMNYLKLLLYSHCLSFDVTIKKADLLLVLKQIFHCDPRQHKYEGRTWEWQRLDVKVMRPLTETFSSHFTRLAMPHMSRLSWPADHSSQEFILSARSKVWIANDSLRHIHSLIWLISHHTYMIVLATIQHQTLWSLLMITSLKSRHLKTDISSLSSYPTKIWKVSA